MLGSVLRRSIIIGSRNRTCGISLLHTLVPSRRQLVALVIGASIACCCSLLHWTLKPAAVPQNLNPFGRNNNTFRYWEEDELIDLLAAVGLSERYERTRQRQFILFAATKPGSSDGN